MIHSASMWKFFLFLGYLLTVQAEELSTGQLPVKIDSKFKANKCCEGKACDGPFETQTLLLPEKLFRIKGHDGTLTMETTDSQDCDGDIVLVNLNRTGGARFPGKSNGFYGKDKLWLNDRSFSRKDFCVFNISEQHMSLKVCKRICSVTNPCIRRCCKRERVWNLTDVYNAKCFESEGDFWNPMNSQGDTGLLHKEPTFLYSNLSSDRCIYITKNAVPADIEVVYQRPFRMAEDGSVWYKPRRNTWKPYREGYYCMEHAAVLPRGVNLNNPSSFEDNTMIFVCESPEDSLNPLPVVRLVVMGVSLVTFSAFYALTCLVYIVLTNKDPVHRWTVVALTTAMTFNFLIMGGAKFSFLFLPARAPGEYFTLCTSIGILTNFTFLCALAWLTAANFDIWLTFRSINHVTRSSLRICLYSAFSFLFPAIIVGTGVILDLVYLDDLESDIITPQYGGVVCGVEPFFAPWIFQYGPMGVILLINVFLYLSTVQVVLRRNKTKKWDYCSHTQSHRESFGMLFRLLLVMGIPWIAEMINWYVSPDDYEHTPWYCDFLDFITVTQAALTFFVLVIKTDVRKDLVSRWSWVETIWRQSGSTGPTKHPKSSELSAETSNTSLMFKA